MRANSYLTKNSFFGIVSLFYVLLVVTFYLHAHSFNIASFLSLALWSLLFFAFLYFFCAQYMTSVSATHTKLQETIDQQSKVIEEKSEYANLIINNSPNIIIISDGHKIIFANNRFNDFFDEYSQESDFILNKDSLKDFLVAHDSTMHEEDFDLRRYLNQNRKLKFIIEHQKYYFNITTTQVSIENTPHYIHILVDITQLENTKKEIESLSITDELTGLYNRRYFNTTYEKELQRTARSKEYFAFALLDIDFFKTFNDTLGHLEGDRALQLVSKSMQEFFHRKSDYVFRMGGEEFGIIVVGHDRQVIKNHISKLQKRIKTLEISHPKSSISTYLTVSVGLFIDKVTINGHELVDFYKEADQLLYKAKETRDTLCSNV